MRLPEICILKRLTKFFEVYVGISRLIFLLQSLILLIAYETSQNTLLSCYTEKQEAAPL